MKLDQSTYCLGVRESNDSFPVHLIFYLVRLACKFNSVGWLAGWLASIHWGFSYCNAKQIDKDVVVYFYAERKV